jgi:hypothetical protein
LTSRTVGGVAGTFTWNPLGQLASATIDGAQASMVYDIDGERLLRRDPGGATTLYLGSMELTLSGGQVAGKRYYTTADEAMIAIRDSGGLTWLLSGLHGSQQLAVNATTGTISRERYLPFKEAKALWAKTPKADRERIKLMDGTYGWRIKDGKTFGIYTRDGRIVSYAD